MIKIPLANIALTVCAGPAVMLTFMHMQLITQLSCSCICEAPHPALLCTLAHVEVFDLLADESDECV